MCGQAKNLKNAKAQLETVLVDLALIKDFLTTTEVLPRQKFAITGTHG